jgi:succinyl-CoA synthetase beta subunit
MNLLEYEAKRLLAASNLPIPRSTSIGRTGNIEITLPVVLKSQVPVGGRGKLGGIRAVETESELRETVDALFDLPIKGYTPTTLLAEEKLDIARELYLAITINRAAASIELIAHHGGGVEIESNESTDFIHIMLDGKNDETAGEKLAEYYGLESQSFVLQDMVKNLYKCFIRNDATLLEINPLILTQQGVLIAGDCKMTLDDAARFRHPEWHFEATVQEANFVTLHENGNVATIANGAGLAMATVDAVVAGDMIPANFLDIGGGASEATVLAAFERIMTFPDIKAIVINIFAGITRCDEVARAVVAAQGKIDHLPPLLIRLAGTNYEQAAEILATAGTPLLPTLEECITKAKETIDG